MRNVRMRTLVRQINALPWQTDRRTTRLLIETHQLSCRPKAQCDCIVDHSAVILEIRQSIAFILIFGFIVLFAQTTERTRRQWMLVTPQLSLQPQQRSLVPVIVWRWVLKDDRTKVTITLWLVVPCTVRRMETAKETPLCTRPCRHRQWSCCRTEGAVNGNWILRSQAFTKYVGWWQKKMRGGRERVLLYAFNFAQGQYQKLLVRHLYLHFGMISLDNNVLGCRAPGLLHQFYPHQPPLTPWQPWRQWALVPAQVVRVWETLSKVMIKYLTCVSFAVNSLSSVSSTLTITSVSYFVI